MGDFVCYAREFLVPSSTPLRPEDWTTARVELGSENFPEEFIGDTQGIEIWSELVDWLKNTDEFTADAIREELERLRTAYVSQMPRLACPRVFISHRSVDAPYALALGKIAKSVGFDVWIDVLDPVLPLLASQPASVRNALATALIVEMALLNCSHLLAVMTSRTQGSFWVPYEYGRIKERYIQSRNVAAWFDASYPHSPPVASTSPIIVPEYLCLGEQLRSKLAISGWLQAELMHWRSTSLRASCPPKSWPYASPIDIP